MIKKLYDFESDNQTIEVFLLTNKNGMEAVISSLGARIISLTAPDKYGKYSDVLMGLGKAEDYANTDEKFYYGAIIGRYANRIEKAKFTLNGVEYTLCPNDNGNSLHGGKNGFDTKNFQASFDKKSLYLTYFSKDSEEGYPANLTLRVTYTLDNKNRFIINYDFVSDKDTVCNFTNHAYFNIGNDDDILDQVLTINSSKITPVDDELIPHGDYLNIDGTPFSFKGGVKIGQNIHSDEHAIKLCNGFDFNYCIDRKTKNKLEFAASVYDKKSGRFMTCETTLPGVQLYTSNIAEGSVGKKVYKNYAALCLETQYYPNSPNCPSYPSPILKKGKVTHETTIYRFFVKK